MVRHTLKMSDHFGTLCIKGLKHNFWFFLLILQEHSHAENAIHDNNNYILNHFSMVCEKIT